MNNVKLDLSICSIGEICSGKSTLSAYLSKKYEIPIASFGGYVRQYCQSNDLSTERESLQNIGEQFISEDCEKFLSNVIDHSHTTSTSMIFDGVRHMCIADKIRLLSNNTVFIYMEIDAATRYQRYLSRESNHSIVSFEEFCKQGEHTVEKEIVLLKDSSDLIMGPTDSYDLVDSFLSKFIK